MLHAFQQESAELRRALQEPFFCGVGVWSESMQKMLKVCFDDLSLDAELCVEELPEVMMPPPCVTMAPVLAQSWNWPALFASSLLTPPIQDVCSAAKAPADTAMPTELRHRNVPSSSEDALDALLAAAGATEDFVIVPLRDLCSSRREDDWEVVASI
eukprot:TRINITY_DN29749_c0_g1_i2.p1 TRINITY_DN29749_c0_g1~~TRINITY_DN29749_c0_g1_i2.p1  ORF type:complete len:157 (+),score=43.06 TRINITY_DN29749_c0_g1_i2:62-532(+)